MTKKYELIMSNNAHCSCSAYNVSFQQLFGLKASTTTNAETGVNGDSQAKALSAVKKKGGRPPGSKNKAGHKAGGTRANAGRKVLESSDESDAEAPPP